MKNKSLTKFTALVLLVTMVTLVIISGTFAKYTSEYDGKGTAIVAKWDVTVTDLNDQKFTADQTINLFDVSKVYELKDVTDFTSDGTDDTDVFNGTDNAIVAPGTWGKVGFKVNIGATNDVTVRYGVDITKLETELPLQFSTDGTTWKTAAEIKAAITTDGLYAIEENIVQPRAAQSSNEVTLYWKWDYEVGSDVTTIANNDKADTALGKDGTKTCFIEAKLGATQVD